jgi:hypothetical protein
MKLASGICIGLRVIACHMHHIDEMDIQNGTPESNSSGQYKDGVRKRRERFGTE